MPSRPALYALTAFFACGLLFQSPPARAADCSTESTQLYEYHSPQKFCVGSKMYRAHYDTETQISVSLVTITAIDYEPGYELGPIQPHRITKVHYQTRNGAEGVEHWEGFSGSGGRGGDTFAFPQFDLFMFPSGCILIGEKQRACVGKKVTWLDESDCAVGADGFSHCKTISATLIGISNRSRFLTLIKDANGKSFYKEFDTGTPIRAR